MFLARIFLMSRIGFIVNLIELGLRNRRLRINTSVLIYLYTVEPKALDLECSTNHDKLWSTCQTTNYN